MFLSYQLYSSRNAPSLEGTLSMLAKAGYAGVEGYPGVYKSPGDLKVLLDKNGLVMPTGHFGLDMVEGNMKQVLKIARAVGMNAVVVPWLDPDKRPTSAAGWKRLGRKLGQLAQAYRGEGLGFAWHNHDFEFLPLRDGSVPFEHLLAAAPLLDWEIDAAWVVRARANLPGWIKRCAGRITMAHLKDIAPRGQNIDEDGWANLGEGTMNWPQITKALSASRCRYWIVEHDNPRNHATFASRSCRNAATLGIGT